MFTGIITDIGTVEQVTGTSGRSLRIATSYDAASIHIGASIACNGVCLTVTERGTSENGSWFDVDCGPETLAVTTVQSWSEGTRLNLERALKVGDELRKGCVERGPGQGDLIHGEVGGEDATLGSEVSEGVLDHGTDALDDFVDTGGRAASVQTPPDDRHAQAAELGVELLVLGEGLDVLVPARDDSLAR